MEGTETVDEHDDPAQPARMAQHSRRGGLRGSSGGAGGGRLRAVATPVALSPSHGAIDSFDQTRDAGPENMRDDSGEAWDEVDQGSDESFPASDPPSFAHPRSKEQSLH